MFRSSPARTSTFADDENIHVVIETPAGSRTKYAWDGDARVFAVRKVLPLGIKFPYDFGFVVDTDTADGDPLDALVISDEPLAVGCLVRCRVLGAIECRTSAPDRPDTVRNDRLIVVPAVSVAGAAWRDIADLGEQLVREIADFLADYTRREGRRFELVAIVGRTLALDLVRDSQR